MNEFDKFIKHWLKIKHYIRYADDFLLLAENREYLLAQLPRLGALLQDRLCLELHPKKIELKTLASGVDFLGWVHFPHHRVLRMATKRRMMRRISENATKESTQSYMGLLKHGDAFELQQEALNQYWLWRVH